MYNNISMDIQKVFNPLTGRMISASGATAKSVKQKQEKVSVLEAVIKRKLTKKPEPKTKKEEASKVLQAVVKRTLTKKPEPNTTKKYTRENLQPLKKNVLRFLIIQEHERLYNEYIAEHLGKEWKKYTKEEMIDYILEPSQGGEYTFNEKYFDEKQMKKEGIL